MEETALNTKYQRRPWLAVLLSLIFPGLGHLYCGKIIRAIVFVFIRTIPIMLIYAILSIPIIPLAVPIACVGWALSLLIGLVAVIDSGYAAKHTRADYELKNYNRWYVYLLLIIMANIGGIGSGLQFRDKFFEAFRVPAASMYPTIEVEDRILASKIAYRNEDPKRGQIVVFNPPDENWRWNYIKRVVAIAGDTIEIIKGDLYINGQKLKREKTVQATIDTQQGKVQGHICLECNGSDEYKIFIADTENVPGGQPEDFAKITVPKGHCFVLGDNRNLSNDSRNFGSVPLSSIKARADYLYYPSNDWSRIGKLGPG